MIGSVRELLLRREGHVEQHLRGEDEEVGRDAVPRHAVFALFDRLVESELLLLRDAVQEDLVVHRRLDVALRTKVLCPIVREVVVGGRQVRVQHIEVFARAREQAGERRPVEGGCGWRSRRALQVSWTQ